MPAYGEQLALPLHAVFPEPAPPPGSQRWTRRRHCWVPASDGGFRAADYSVAPIDERTAASAFCMATPYIVALVGQ